MMVANVGISVATPIHAWTMQEFDRLVDHFFALLDQ